MPSLLAGLQGGDRRSIGRSEEVAAEVLSKPSLFHQLFGGMLDADPIMLPRLKLTTRERRKATDILLGYLDDQSSITRTFALQALADLAEDDSRLQRRVVGLLRDAARSGTPAMKSRAKKLLKKLST